MAFPEDMPDIWDIVSFKLIFVVFAGAVLRQFMKGTQFIGRENAKKKVIVITGANCGIGKQIVRELNYRGGMIYIGCRDQEKGTEAITELAKLGCPIDRLVMSQVDMASFASVRAFAKFVQQRESQIDVLINNAGVMMYPKHKLTEDGHEYQWQVNYLGHFLLTNLLRPQLEASPNGRVINVSCRSANSAELNPRDLNSGAVDAKDFYDLRAAFGYSKLALVMMARSITKEWRKDGSSVCINACHPGICYTRQLRHTPLLKASFIRYTLGWVAWFLMKTPKDGAQTPIYLALDGKLEGVSGKFYKECGETKTPEAALKDDVCETLYEYSLKACGLRD